ncbi:DUF4191 domain-containing protein [Nocardioidaceae bacterium SCSIO 66511]|nr:DUF4191 domain-containing protein [Nocardioidaceae bacterium SCSIO 66511]
MSTPAAEPPKGRLRQIAQAYRITKRSERFIGLRLLAWFLVVGAIFGALGYLIMGWWLAVPFGILSGFLAAVIVFGRRAEKAAYAQIDGQVGAAAGALQMLKRGWHVKSAVAFTKNQDVLHRVVGRPGIVLVGEGVPSRVRNLLAAEKKKHARVAGEVPIVDIIVGDGEGQVPIPKLIKHIQKLPKSTTPAEITELMQRMRALDAMRPQAPVPHGPMPTSMKGARKLMQGR